MPSAPLDEVIAIVRSSRRYGRLHDRTLRRIAEHALLVERGHIQSAAKRAKRSLHQIFGAFLPDRPNYARLLDRIHAASKEGDAPLRTALSEAMALHASTRERRGILERFYREIFERLAPARRVLDLACGLNPLAIPWMKLASEARYVAIDLDHDAIGFLSGCLDVFGVDHDARVLDVLEERVEGTFDLALLLKLVPCLERQAPEAPRALLRSVPAKQLVVSFPTRSIGGRQKGMREKYSADFEALLDQEELARERLEFPGELVYVVSRGPASEASSSSVSLR